MYGDQLVNFSVDEAATSAGVDEQGNKLSDGVRNNGIVVADGGTIIMSARAARDVVDNVVNMKGVAQARSVSEKNGVIILDGGDGKVSVSGRVDVSGKTKYVRGGKIKILARKIHIEKTAVIDASGSAGGGEILIGGNYQGKGPEQNAYSTQVDQGAIINADAISNGNGGKVIVWANQDTEFYGSISARGGALSGDGGFVETSGKQYLDVNGSYIDLRAPFGKTGTWLLDPTNIFIAQNQANATAAGMIGNNTSANSVSGGVSQASGAVQDSLLTVGTLLAALSSANVNVTTANVSGTGVGNITVVDPISWAANTALTLTANNDIIINGAITSTSFVAVAAFGQLTLNAGRSIILNSAIKTNSGSVSLTAPTSITLNSTITTQDAVAAVAITNSGTGNIFFNAGSGVTTGNASQTYNALGTILASGATVALTATGGNITFGNGSTTGSINGAANLTLTSNGTITVGSGHIGTNTPLTTFTTSGTGTLTSNAGTLYSPAVTTTGNQVYGTTITGSGTGTVFLLATGSGTIQLNNAINNPSGYVLLRAANGVKLNCAGCSPIINAGTLQIDNGFVITPLTLLANATITTNTVGGSNLFNGSVTGAFNLTVNQPSTSTTTFSKTINIAALTTNNNGTFAFNGGNVTTSGAQSFAAPITIGAPITFQASSITFKAVTAGANNVTILADAITLNGGPGLFTGTGALQLQPRTTNASISLGSSNTGTLKLSSTSITGLGTGFSGITIGALGATGAMDIDGGPSFGTSIVTLNAGNFTNGPTGALTAGTLNFKANTAAGTIGASGNSIRILATNLSLNTNNGNAFISSTGGTNFSAASSVGSGTLTLSSMGGTVTQSAAGKITAATLAATLSGSSSALNLNSASNAITNLGAITAPGGFSLTNALAGNATTTVTGNITTTNTPISISTGSSTGGYTQNNGVLLSAGTGAITITSDAIVLNTAGAAFSTNNNPLTLKPFSAATPMSFGAGTAGFDLTSSEVTSLRSGLGGGSWVVIGDSTASTGAFTMNAPVSFSSLTLFLNAGSFVNAAAANVINAGSLNLTARNPGGAIGASGAANAIYFTTPFTRTNLFLITNNGSAFVASAKGINIGTSSLGSGNLTLTSIGGTSTQQAGGIITANSLAATLTAGSLSFNNAANAISTLGVITAPGGFDFTNGNNPVTVAGAINTSAGNGAVSINTGTGLYTQNNTFGISSGSGAITITADSINLLNVGNNSFTTSGALTLQPFSAATAMSLAGASGFDLSTAEMTAVTGGAAGTISIGSAAASTGLFTIGGAVNFAGKTLTLNAGSFTDIGANVITATTLNLLARNSGGAIGASGANAVGISATNLSLNTNNGNAFITSAGGTNFSSASNLGTGILTLTSIGGDVTQSASGAITAGNLTGTLTTGALNLNSASNAITNLGDITAPGGFNLTNGNNSTTVTGTINTTNNAISINTGTGTYNQNDVDLNSGSGAITITGDGFNLASNSDSKAFNTTGVLTIQPSSAATSMSLGGSSTFDLTAAEINSLAGGVTGAGSITIGNVGSTGTLTLGSNITFPGFGTGGPTISLIAGSFASTGGYIIANNLNLLANNSGQDIGSAVSPITVSTLGFSVNTTNNGSAYIGDLGYLIFTGASSVGTGTLGLYSSAPNTTISQTAAAPITAGTLIANLSDFISSGRIDLTAAANAITNLGDITAVGGFNLSNGNNPITVTGAINVIQNGIGISTGSGLYTQNDVDIVNISGPITITSDAINLLANTGGDAFQTSGVLTLKPSAGTNMSLGGAAAYDLSVSEINSISSGILANGGSIVIGDAASTGSLTTGTAGGGADLNFLTNTVTLNAGSFSNANATNIITAGTLHLVAKNAAGAIGSSGAANAIRVSSPINLTLNSNNGDAFIASSGGINFGTSSLGSGHLTLTSIGGPITQSVGGIITANSLSATLTTGALNFNNAANAIPNLGVITAPGGFNFTNGNNPITVIGAINTSAGNGAVNINIGTGLYTQNNTFNISSGSGSITIIADSINLLTAGNAFTTTGALTLKPSTASTTMSLAGSNTFDLTASEITSLAGGVTGSITIGDASASTGVLDVGGAVNFGAKTVTLNAGSFTDAGSNIITATSLNFLARNSGGAIGASGAALGIAATNLTFNTTGNGNAFFTSAGGINLGGGTSSVGTGTLTYSAGGAINQTGSITAGSLALTSVGGILLTNSSNAVSGLSATNSASGDIQLTTATPTLTLSGISEAGTGQILINNTAGALATSGTIATIGNGNIGLTASSTVSISNQINATAGNVSLTGTGINLGANIITTGGNILFNNPVTLTANVNSLTSATGNTTFFNTITGGGFSLATTTSGSGVTTFSNTVSGLSALTTTGSTAINTGSITTTDLQQYNGAITLGADTSLSGFGFIFGGSITGGGHNLTLNLDDTDMFFNTNSITGINNLQINNANKIFFSSNNTNLTTTGSQTYNGRIFLGTNFTTTLTGAGITLNQSVTGNSSHFILSDSSTSVINGAITGLSTLQTNAVTFNNGNVTSTGTQSYGAAALGADTTLTGAGITLSGVTGGAHSLVLADSGTSILNGAITGLTTLQTNAVTFNNGNVTSSGTQSYGAAALGADTTLTGAGITLSGVTGGAHGLVLADSGTSILNGAITGLSTLQTNAVTLNNGNVTSTGTQSYGAATLGADATLTGAGITLNGVTGGAHGLVLADSGTSTLNGAITGLTTLQTNAVTFNNGNVTSSGTQSYGVATLGADTTLTGAGITLSGVTGGAHSLVLADSGTSVLNGAITGLTTLQTNAVTLNNGNVTSTGTQSYGAATLGADATLTGAGITLSNVTGGTHGLVLADSGTSVLNGAITGLTTLQTNAVTFNNGNVTSSGTQTYNGVATLNAPTILTSNAGDISLNSALSGGVQTLTLAGGAAGNHIFTLNDITSLDTLVVNGNAAVTNTLALLSSSGVNTLHVTNNGGSSGSNGTIAASNLTTGGFNNIQNLTGGAATNNFIFDDGAAINGNLVGGGSGSNNTLDFSNYSTAVSANLFTGEASMIGGNFSNIKNFVGTDAGSTTNSTLSGLGDTIISAANIGHSGANTFIGFGNLAGLANNTFTFNTNASISGNLTGGSNSTLNISALTSPIVNLVNNTATGIMGVFSGINNFIGSGVVSTLVGPLASTTWNINGANQGTAGNYNFTDFGYLVGGSSTNNFVLNNGGSVGGSITGGNGTNTLTVATGTTNWVVNNANAGSVTGVSGGFSKIQNLVGGTGENTFTFTGNGRVSSINGGNTTNINIVDFSGYAPVNLTLTVPASGNEFNSGSVDSNGSSILGSFTQVQKGIGSTSGQSFLILPRKANISVTYTNAAKTSGFIGDPFYFVNFTLEGIPVPPTPSTPSTPSTPGPILNQITTTASQAITPFTEVQYTMPSTFTSPVVNSNITQLFDQQLLLDQMQPFYVHMCKSPKTTTQQSGPVATKE